MSDLQSTEKVPACECSTCVGACKRRPGWFAPGEAEKAAELMKMGLPEFFKTYLAVDYWADREKGINDIFLLEPRLHDEPGGKMYPFVPTGRCVFLTEDERCMIHAAKPYECRSYHHDRALSMTMEESHGTLPLAWNTPEHQAQVKELLGTEPAVASPSFFDFLEVSMQSMFQREE